MMLCAIAILVLAFAPFAAWAQRERYAYSRAAARGEGAYVAKMHGVTWLD